MKDDYTDGYDQGYDAGYSAGAKEVEGGSIGLIVFAVLLLVVAFALGWFSRSWL